MKKGSNIRRFKTAFILGAGLGTRLRPLTEACPKPLLEIGGRPIITYAMDHLLTVGVDRFIVNTHHRPEVYLEKLPERSWRGVPILFRHEPVLLDTAGGLKNIEDLLKDDEAIFCYNGDVITDLPLNRLLEAHGQKRPEVTLALRSSGPLLNVNIDEDGSICDLRHTLGKPGVRSCLFAGIYAVETSFLQHLGRGKIETVVFPMLRRIAEKPGAVRGILIDEGAWHDIGSPEEYEKIKTLWPPHEEAAEPRDDGLKAFARSALRLETGARIRMALIHRGGSERDIHRVSAHTGSFILVDYNPARRENALYAAIAEFLRGIGVPVPRILAHDRDRCFILMEDLGERNLYSLKDEGRKEREALYRKTLEAIRKLHAFPADSFPHSNVALMEPFGPDLYRWERTYFLENCVRNACGIDLGPSESEKLERELVSLAGELMGTGRTLVHRDFQSQNVMIRDGEPVVIDFQGMRFGTFFYDLGSLLCDPYVELADEERLDLLAYYHGLSKDRMDWKTFQRMFWIASVQRLMQALGAYGFLALRKNLTNFLEHIPTGLAHLHHAVQQSGSLPRLEDLLNRCRVSLLQMGVTFRR